MRARSMDAREPTRYGTYRRAEAFGETEVYGVESRVVRSATLMPRNTAALKTRGSIKMSGQSCVCGPRPNLFVDWERV